MSVVFGTICGLQHLLNGAPDIRQIAGLGHPRLAALL
jgi:hypothetical protein